MKIQHLQKRDFFPRSLESIFVAGNKEMTNRRITFSVWYVGAFWIHKQNEPSVPCAHVSYFLAMPLLEKRNKHVASLSKVMGKPNKVRLLTTCTIDQSIVIPDLSSSSNVIAYIFGISGQLAKTLPDIHRQNEWANSNATCVHWKVVCRWVSESVESKRQHFFSHMATRTSCYENKWVMNTKLFIYNCWKHRL